MSYKTVYYFNTATSRCAGFQHKHKQAICFVGDDTAHSVMSRDTRAPLKYAIQKTNSQKITGFYSVLN